jgi:hypothetical protein
MSTSVFGIESSWKPPTIEEALSEALLSHQIIPLNHHLLTERSKQGMDALKFPGCGMNRAGPRFFVLLSCHGAISQAIHYYNKNQPAFPATRINFSSAFSSQMYTL